MFSLPTSAAKSANPPAPELSKEKNVNAVFVDRAMLRQLSAMEIGNTKFAVTIETIDNPGGTSALTYGEQKRRVEH